MLSGLNISWAVRLCILPTSIWLKLLGAYQGLTDDFTLVHQVLEGQGVLCCKYLVVSWKAFKIVIMMFSRGSQSSSGTNVSTILKSVKPAARGACINMTTPKETQNR